MLMGHFPFCRWYGQVKIITNNVVLMVKIIMQKSDAKCIQVYSA